MFASKKSATGAVGFAMCLFLVGCDSADSNPAKPEVRGPVGTTDLTGSSDFDRDLIAAKRGTAGTTERLEAIEAVLSRYGVPHSPLNPPAEQQPGPVAVPAAKTATTTFVTTVRNFNATNDVYTYYRRATVKPGKTIRVEAVASTDNEDPYLVAFYQDDAPGTATAYTLKFVAANDDVADGNRNSRISWKNTGTVNKSVTVVGFNYLPSNRGTVDVDVFLDGVTTSYPNRWLGGKVVYAGSPNPAVPGGCAPFFTRVTEKTRYGGGYPAAALVMDFNAMKGGIIWDDPSTVSQSLDFVPQLSLPYPSFGLLFKANGNAVSVPLLDDNVASGYNYTQQEYYKCP